MAFTINVFGRKVRALRNCLQQEREVVAQLSGIPASRLGELELGRVEPTGDEVLMLADFYKRDFRYFLNDDAPDPANDIEILFREHGSDLRLADRMAVAEFIYLCSCEAFLEHEMGRESRLGGFRFRPTGSFYKGQGEKCAQALRDHLGYANNEVVRDVFGAMRQMGYKVFRRRLENSGISGLFMMHPEAGPCVLVNFAEGQARQRFSAAHEWAHALLDNNSTNFSTVSDLTGSDSMVELRANTFASNFLIPPGLLRSVTRERWTDPREIANWANNLRVSVPAILSALVNSRILTREERDQIRPLVPRIREPIDPELEGLPPTQTERKAALLERGLSKTYVDLALDAYSDDKVSRGLLADMLLASSGEVSEIAALFGRTLKHG